MSIVYPLCSIENCNRPVQATELCNKHYSRKKKWGDPLYPVTEHKRRVIAPNHSQEYKIWLYMKQRCYNPKHDSYHKYGARGIKVCDEWMNNFRAFLDDVGYRPTPKHSIDRINNDGNYEPGNVRWATAEVQARNVRPKPLPRSGHTGVIIFRKKYQARISIGGTKIHLGTFDRLEDAAKAYQDALAERMKQLSSE